MSRQLKFLMLESELSSHGKRNYMNKDTQSGKKQVVKKRKIPLEELKAFVEAHPDTFLREIAAHFDCAVPSVWAALKQIHVTLKKTTSFKEQDPEKIAEFLDILNSLKDLPVVYIDETGIDRYLYRSHARAPRGEKVYEKINGRRFERTSIVAGQVDGEFIAPMIYKESMTSDFFVEWFKTQLLPALKTPHVIVMDNASFHPKIDTFSYLYHLIPQI